MKGYAGSRLATACAIAVVTLSSCVLALQSPAAMGSPRVGAWNTVSSPAPTGRWYAVDYAAGHWVALGDAGEAGISSNGTTWSEYPVPTGSWHSVTFGDGRFVALSSETSSSEEIVSTNGVTWTAVAGPSGPWTGLAFGGGRFVAVSSSGQIAASTNGLQWSTEWSHPNYDLTSVTYGDGHFVVADAALGALVTSTSSSAWSRYLFPTAGLSWGTVVYGNGNFVALGGSSSGAGYAATSVFGNVWAIHHLSLDQITVAATFGCGDFVAIGQSASGADEFLLSASGEDWTSSTPPGATAALWTAVNYGDQSYVAVASTGDIVSAESDSNCAATIPTAPLQVSGNIHNGQVWTYMHPSSSPGGAPISAYRVTISNGSMVRQCRAALYFQPNCIIDGLRDGQVYWVTAQAQNRFGYSVTTDPIFVIPVKSWNFSATTASPVIARSAPVVVQVTGVVANSEGVYPTSLITVHFGTDVTSCHANPFGECLITIANPAAGITPIYATYTGYGRSYRSATTYVTVTA